MFDKNQLIKGNGYTRIDLAKMWGFKDYHGIGRGIVTFKGDQTSIVLFLTYKKTADRVQYVDRLENGILYMEGEKAHRSDSRIFRNLKERIDSFYLFYRENKDKPFIYYGPCYLIDGKKVEGAPSKFQFSLDEPLKNSLEDNLSVADYLINSENSQQLLQEGKVKLSYHLKRERNLKNRLAAIKFHGSICKICGFDFNKVYGKELADNFIEVHHIQPISQGLQPPDPKKDLIPVCSNCHRMLHRKRSGNISVNDLKKLVNENLKKY